MARDVNTLLDELTAHVGVALDLAYKEVPAGQRRELFIHRLDRDTAAATASVIRLAGGPADGYSPIVTLTVQCYSQAADDAAALARSWAILDVFVDGQTHLPLRNVPLTSWRLLRIEPVGKPMVLGTRADGVDASFNWIIEAAPAALAG